ncbi:glycosyltransferase family 4 protein [Luteimonas terrae]|uniref:Glycosyltransferase involved in cell wall biosynthesis n=1 Tax=Luteimonas terrae TaxID=1530191 RepID=A0ABU1XW67_9GAMM|nr:glycosyltransferase family 1 protein [Luteimonas terrae]MDR7193012.1 glycosyltransferase involved in cell wall biosynthesis [Luteimonas terrae]
MRYAIVTDTYPPDINGVALTLQSYVQGLRARGHEVEIVRPARVGEPPGADAQSLRIRGLRVPRYPGLRLALPAGQRLRARWRAARPDAIYVATEGPLGWSALNAAQALDIPVLTALHTRFDLYMGAYGVPWLQPAALSWMRRFHARAEATLVATRALALELREAGIGHPVVLSRAVDCAQFDPARRDLALRQAWGVDENGLVAIHVGRIAAEKNLGLAVRAFRALQAERPDARMVFVGDGPERSALQAANPDFIFSGSQRGDDLGRHFASADLFLFPSRSETFGNVVLESMACGVPQVAFDHGATEHLCDGFQGARIAGDDEDAFVAAAIGLAQDPSTRRAMGLAGREAMRRLTPAHVADDLDALLAGLRGSAPDAHTPLSAPTDAEDADGRAAA